MDSRAVTPVVGKVFEVGLVALYIGLLTTTLYAGAVPEYRTAAGAEVGERVLASATQRVEQSIPPAATTVQHRQTVSIPQTIRGEQYEIRAANESLVLLHPNENIDGKARLALPDRVVSVSGTWRSTDETALVVEDAPGGLRVRLTEVLP
ncbi:hypothetical protein [Haladaptatus sp. DJG-WS-42]|uniref:DUF7266 family protein n=1 Tax=Haladaptatus sp. DJG-WS-42 TaxID=3120516 RepID=UPI0030CFE3C1